MIVSDKYVKELLRNVVAQRAKGRCEFPGCNKRECDPHHWQSKKGNSAILYDPDCCIYLCAEHHTGNTLSAHHSPVQFKKIIIESNVRTQDWADQVLFKARAIVKNDNYFREEWKVKLLAVLERLVA